MRRVGNRIIGGALIAWLLALMSCGTMPMEPTLQQAEAVNHAVAKPAGPAAHEGQAVVVQPRPPHPPVDIDDGVKVVKTVQGDVGDTLHVNGITLTLPPDAFEGTAQVTVTVPDPTKRECHLEIFPASLNHFDIPVRLEFDVRGAVDPRMMSVFWYDETGHCWVPITTTIDIPTRKIWAELPHFSIYKADSEVQTRAGW